MMLDNSWTPAEKRGGSVGQVVFEEYSIQGEEPW
jgi:hypothetical protein